MKFLLGFGSFALYWIGVMAIIGLALLITQLFRKKEDNSFENPKEYAENYEKSINEPTAEKPIKKELRNPFFLSHDEIKETKEQSEK